MECVFIDTIIWRWWVTIDEVSNSEVLGLILTNLLILSL